MNPKLSRILAAALACVPLAALPAAPSDASSACLSPAAWTALEGGRSHAAVPGELLASMAKRDVVLLGEHHDQEDDHRWQVQVLAALHTLRPNMTIGFEMFPRRLQPVLDRWVASELTVKQFQEQTEWDKVWNVPLDLYLPLFQFARINRIPMLALNVDLKLNRAILERGWDNVPEADREGVGRPAPPSEAYRDFLFEAYSHHTNLPGKGDAKPRKTDAAFRHFVESQTVWDRAMAEALARQATSSDKPLVVGIMGSGHVRFGHGVPHQLRSLGFANQASLLPVPADAGCQELRTGLADAVFALPRLPAAKPEPPRLGVRLEQSDGGVRVAEVVADSLAERSGLKTGDHLVEVAGQPAKKVMPVIASIRQQPGGSWLPMRIRRGEETFEVVVKFPAKL